MVLGKAGAPPSDTAAGSSTAGLRSFSQLQCPICIEHGDMLVFALTCGHMYCADCVRRYLTTRFMDDGEGRHIKCPSDGCSLYFTDNDLAKLLPSSVLTT